MGLISAHVIFWLNSNNIKFNHCGLIWYEVERDLMWHTDISCHKIFICRLHLYISNSYSNIGLKLAQKVFNVARNVQSCSKMYCTAGNIDSTSYSSRSISKVWDCGDANINPSWSISLVSLPPRKIYYLQHSS